MTKANQNSKTKGTNSKASGSKSNSSMSTKTDTRQQITDKIISILERGPEVWRKTWSTAAAQGLPVNWNDTQYRGINVLNLWMETQERGFPSSKWMTFRQAKELGGMVRKGEKGALVVYFKMLEVEDQQNMEELKTIPILKHYVVFNTEQIDGLSDADQQDSSFKAIKKVDSVIDATGADIRHGGGRAAYSPSHDFIIMPKPESFETPANYYATVLHELSHWTGHDSRLGRDLSGRFGDDQYAAEELVAELSSAFLMGSFGLEDATIEGHASYLDSWLRVLKADKGAIFAAAAAAQKAHDFILCETARAA